MRELIGTKQYYWLIIVVFEPLQSVMSSMKELFAYFMRILYLIRVPEFMLGTIHDISTLVPWFTTVGIAIWLGTPDAMIRVTFENYPYP